MATCLSLVVAFSVREFGRVVASLLVLRLRFTCTLTCCSVASRSPATRVGISAVPAIFSSVLSVGKRIRNFSGTGSGLWAEKDLAVKSSGAVMTRCTLCPLPKVSTDPSTVRADVVMVVPSGTMDSTTLATCRSLVTCLPLNELVFCADERETVRLRLRFVLS